MEFASLDELSELVDASVSTVRRDVSLMESRGVVCRTHGGARLTNPKSDEYTFSTRDTQQLAQKEAIARACASLIPPNQTVIIDAGTTCYHVAVQLEAKTPHIITNSLPVANHFSASSRLEVVVSGGVIYPKLGVLVGPLAVEAFTKLRADVAILSCGGVTEEGISNSHGLLIEIQRAMINAARRVILCVDSSKFGRQSISKLCELDVIDAVVTDMGAPESFLALLRERNIHVTLANGEEVAPMPELSSGPAPEPEPLVEKSHPGRSFDDVPLNVL